MPDQKERKPLTNGEMLHQLSVYPRLVEFIDKKTKCSCKYYRNCKCPRCSLLAEANQN